ncbi:MAG: hypothetical protein QGH94_07295 [Phycisphaerae bacterium]|jgi:hypothetical protein|nr:hypothetical protein [Phycisphaerae bacterium]MDP7287782.1 hypothetical protein [Phycisphaerae bacterium]
MGDLKSKKLIYLKGVLFLLILILSAGLIVLETRSWRVALLLGLAIWTSARLYYFMFYVIEKYVDSEFRFSSIYSFVKHMLTNNKS